MALNQEKLRGGLESAFSTPTSVIDGARRLSTAYFDFALDAQSCAGAVVPAAVYAAKAKLEPQLVSLFQTCRDPGTYTTQLSAYLAAFWLTPPIPFVGPTPGFVTIAVPTPLQVALFSLIMGSNARTRAGGSVTAAAQAQQWAQVLAGWTRTVVVAHAPPSACVGPLL